MNDTKEVNGWKLLLSKPATVRKSSSAALVDGLEKLRDRYLDNTSYACLYSSSKLIHTINVGLKPRVAANEMNADARSLWTSGRRLTTQDFRPFYLEWQNKRTGKQAQLTRR